MVQPSVFHGLLEHRHLVLVVVDGEGAVQAQVVAVAAQHPGAEGVESGYAQLLGLGAHQPLQALPHLSGSLIGEGDPENAVGANSTHPHQVGDAVGDDPGLAAARPSHDKQRPLDSLHSLPLRGVQAFEYLEGGGQG